MLRNRANLVRMDSGAAPFFMSERAMQKLKGRKTKVASYYFDMNLVGDYWSGCCSPFHKFALLPERL